ncbi:ABC transporter ATP-binding protein [Meiothermus sp.]|uniref:ABC transporter ATP-binding protein n=1 Tax=Meiothermus sp. TaxID=1955249 RepID=UPI0021DEFF6F|nr:ABC transporter ATP-binding protein [Meiothermus sp.]GIW35176.1 MAG: ABC transporter ATP-binding protein [Meiothermus sp.]
MSVLEAIDLYRFYHVGDEEVRALRGVSLRIEPGELVAVVGASGSGKSTLLACLAGLDEPDGGYVSVAGQRLTRRSEEERAELRARHVGVLLQSDNLFEHLSTLENVQFATLLAHQSPAGAADWLQRLGLGERLYARPSQLSGGELARAGLAAALAAQPTLLLADEPTAEVDAETEALVLGEMESFCARGGAALISTHSPELARRAGRVLHIRDGRFAHA